MVNFRHYISADEVQTEHLTTHFNCSKKTVSRALNFEVHSLLARSIRTYAVNFLGCKLTDNLSQFL